MENINKDCLKIKKSRVRLQFSRMRDEFAQKNALPGLVLKICGHLHQLMALLPQGATIASYRTRGTEVPTHNFENDQSHHHWVYPRVQGGQLQFLKPKGFSKGSYGIEEPTKDSEEIPLHDIDMILVPAVAFDHQGHRLGSGKGFYDHTLSHYRGIKVGIAYNCQISPHPLTIEAHDIPMEYIVTENYTLKQLKKGF